MEGCTGTGGESEERAHSGDAGFPARFQLEVHRQAVTRSRGSDSMLNDFNVRNDADPWTRFVTPENGIGGKR